MPRWEGTTEQRGYGRTHQQLRRRIQPIVDAGQAYCTAATCLMLTRHIPPGSQWDLGHTPDRTGYTGPEHRRCNRADGAARGNQARPRRIIATTGGSTCGTCGIRYHYAARNCCICGGHYHPSHNAQRTCSRTCGIDYKRRTAATRQQ